MAFSYHSKNFRGMDNEAGIFLRNLHGSAGERSIARVVPTYEGKEIPYTYEVTPAEISLKTKQGSICICFANTDTILFSGTGDGLGMKLLDLSNGQGYNYIHEVPYEQELFYMMNMFKNNCRYLVSKKQGTLCADQDWHAERTAHCALEIEPEQGGFFIALEEVATEWRPKPFHYDYAACKAAIEENFVEFYRSMPTVPECYETTREMAAYVNWTSCVKKFGFLTRDAMFMSKNWMTNVWSWDHCFNAMALSYGNPNAAWDQFMIMFDMQDETGVLPDSINDARIVPNFCKPPIHGWALQKMMKQMELSQEQLHEAYEKLEKWTNWWLNYRDHDQDGICEYYHGNDSGWDNSTAFAKLPPVELPDLNAFLVLQMDVLSDLAGRLGRIQQKEEWKAKADGMLEKLLKHCFENGLPKALLSRTHEEVPNDSLILYLPIVLGERLPAEIRNNLIEVLKSDRFYTAHGFATESPQSPCYLSDGYWRGPIWAPSSMIVIDGLYQSGEIEFAKEATCRFCNMVQKSGCAENFDALTGEGLRDRAYTWTSSVFLVMAHEYLG